MLTSIPDLKQGVLALGNMVILKRFSPKARPVCNKKIHSSEFVLKFLPFSNDCLYRAMNTTVVEGRNSTDA